MGFRKLLKTACSRKMHVLAINTCRWIATSDAWPVTRLLCCSVVSLPFAQMFSRTFLNTFSPIKNAVESIIMLSVNTGNRKLQPVPHRFATRVHVIKVSSRPPYYSPLIYWCRPILVWIYNLDRWHFAVRNKRIWHAERGQRLSWLHATGSKD